MTPALKASSKIDAGLENMFDEPRYYFEERTRERARQLYERWEAQNWGKGEVAEDSTDDDEANDVNGDGSASSSKRKKSSSDATARRDSGADIAISTIRAPRVSHPIFGEHGIMHGVVLNITDGRKSYILDSRYPKPRLKFTVITTWKSGNGGLYKFWLCFMALMARGWAALLATQRQVLTAWSPLEGLTRSLIKTKAIPCTTRGPAATRTRIQSSQCPPLPGPMRSKHRCECTSQFVCYAQPVSVGVSLGARGVLLSV
jgi:hypothetical protein